MNDVLPSHQNKNSCADASNKTHLKDPSNRKFYNLPDDYDLKSTDTVVTNQSDILLNEIYSAISSKKAAFEGPYGWRSVIYCDYAASGQPLNFIEDYIREKVLPFYGNTHTTITATSLQSTYFRHEAKDIIRKAVNASEHDAVFFSGSGCTSAVNKLIHGLNLKHTDTPVIVFVGPFEHHSNLLPWREINAQVIRIKETEEGKLDITFLENELKKYYNNGNQLIGSFSAASNITGIITDDVTITVLLHKYGALSFWDYASAAPYLPVDMNPLVMGQNEGLADKDAIFFSMHKFVGGPGAPGILIAKKSLFSNPVPYEPGGGTIFFVSRNSHRYLKDVEVREEGGTPSIIGDIRAGMAFQLKEAVGTSVISKREFDICRLVNERLGHISELKILGNTSIQRLPIYSFLIYHQSSGLYLHHNFVCALLNDMFGIQTRSGCACAGPYALDLLGINEPLALKFDEVIAEKCSLDRVHLRRKGEYSDREILRPGFTRLTLPYFMSDSDIDFILNAVVMVAKFGWKLLPQYTFNPETGEWKHKKRQVYLDRKWLGSISYKSGYFQENANTLESIIPPNKKEVLELWHQSIENSSQEAAKKFTPDQHLIFDEETSKFRWFLLPSEAKQYISKDLSGKIKQPVFVVKSFTYNEVINSRNLYNSNEDEKNSNANIHELHISNDRNIVPLNLCNESTTVMCCSVQNVNLTLPSSSIHKCKWHSPPPLIFRPLLKALQHFQMIKDGDKVLICLSGGKDSLSLLHSLHQYQFYAKSQGISFEIGAMTVDPKSPLYDPSPLKVYLKALNMPYFYEEQDIVGQAAAMDKCTSICSFCSRLKRGRIYSCAIRENYNVVALGQHLDDLAESFIMSIFHNGRLRTMKASYTDKSSSLRIIRPFVFVREKDLRLFAEKKKLPVIPENCPACFEAPKERHRIKQLLATQEIQFPNLYRSLKTAMHPLMAINVTGVEDQLLGKNSTGFVNFFDLDEDI